MSSDTYAPLADYVELRRGSTYKSALLGQEGPVLLGLSSIARGGGFRRDALKTYGGDSPSTITLAPGDIYVSLKDVTQSADLLGAVSRVPSDIASGRLTQDTVRLIFKDVSNADYVYWLLRTPQYREYCRTHAIGVTTLALPRDDFLAFGVPPIRRERRSLFYALQVLDDKIEHNRRLADRLEEHSALAFARLLANPDYQRVRVNEVTSMNAASHTAKKHSDTIEYIDISNTSCRRIASTKFLEWADAPSRARRIVRSGDTLISTVRPERRSLVFIARDRPNLTASTGFAVLTARDYSPSLLYRATTTDEAIAHFSVSATGSAYPAVAPKVIGDWLVPLPPDRGEAFERLVRPLEDARWNAFEESNTLAAVRDELLPKLISGQLRVPESYDPDDVIGTLAEEAAVAV